MATIETLIRRMRLVELRNAPQGLIDTRIPYLVLNEECGDWPGYEARNQEMRQLARRLRQPAVKEYVGFDPAEMDEL